jgi:hypothetical protein
VNNTIVLTGTNFASGAVVKIGTFTVPAGQVTVNNATTITFTLTAAQNQALGVNVHNVTVTVSSQVSNTQTFTISAPTFTGISPNSVEYNVGQLFTITTNYHGAAPTAIIGTTSFPTTVVNGTTITLNLSAAQINTLGVGTHLVKINNSGAESPNQSLTIIDPIPTVASAASNPTPPLMLTAHTITLTGTKFQTYSTVRATSGGNELLITPSSVPNTTTLLFALSADQTETLLGINTAPMTVRFSVINGSQSSPTNYPLIVTEVTPVLSTLDNGSGSTILMENTTYNITLTGTKFENYAKVAVGTLPDITPTSVNAANNSLTFTLSGADIAALGGAGVGSTNYTVRVKNGSVSSNTLTITVIPQAGNTPPGNFSSSATVGTTAGTLTVTWTSAGGTDPVTYTLKGIPQSSAIAQDGTISSAEFESAAIWTTNIASAVAPYAFTGAENTGYCFAAKATNAFGASYSTTSCATTPAGNAPPGSFTLTAQTGTDTGEIDVSWGNAGGNPSPAYILKGILKSDPIAQDGVISSTEFSSSATWAVNTTGASPYTFSGVAVTEYCFAARAENTQGNTLSNTSCATTQDVPAAPTGNTGGDSGGGGGGGGGAGGGGGGGGGGGDSTPFCGNDICSPGEAATCPQDCGGSPACTPTLELCDGIDNDCDAEVDEGCAAGDSSACYNGALDEGEYFVDCGGVCSSLCLSEDPIPESFYRFATVAASPLLLFVQLVAYLFGGTPGV